MNYRFLVNTLTDWDEPPRARHQVTYALAKRYPVVFISSNRIGFPNLREQHITDNLCVITPYFIIDSRIRTRIPLLNRIYQKWLYSKLNKVYQGFYVINFDFTALYLHSYFKDSIYYCNDDHIGLSYKYNRRWIANYHNSCEQTVIKHAGLCIATSRFLVEKIKALNPNTFEIRLGSPDIKDVRINYNKLTKNSSIIHVGFVGYLHTIDSEILTSLLSKSDIFLTIIGPINKYDSNRIKDYSNIRLTGTLTGQALYDEVNKFDVGLIPYDLKSEIDRTPNKLWLYLSLGKPAVVSNIKGIRDWEFPDRYLYRAELNTEFYELIKKAYNEDNDILVSQRVTFAKNNSWDNRIEDFLQLCQRTFTS
jgi:hypothetical protein